MAKNEGKKKGKEPLGAVVIADLFGPQFQVFQKPTALWPLANMAMIDYTMEFLSRTEVEKVTVVCCKESDAVKAHVISNWSGHFGSLSVLQAEASLSFGDAMRELDSRGDIKSDFLLVQAGSLCTSSLADAIQEHRSRRVKDKSCVMTLIQTEVSKHHVIRESGPDNFVAYDQNSQQILHIRNIIHRSQWKHLEIPKNCLGREDVRLRGDLLDTGIAICSAQIPPLFSDNFDFDSKQNIIKEIFDNEEILGFKCHVHVLPQREFAGTVNEFAQYQRFNSLIVQRWTAPLLPDGISGRNRARYRSTGNFCYFPFSVAGDSKSSAQPIIDRSVSIRKSIVGPGSEIHQNSKITNCSIGANCYIGEHVTLNSCILWDGVRIEKNSQCENSVFGRNAALANNSTIGTRSVFGSNVKLTKPELTFKCGTFVSEEVPDLDMEEDYSISNGSDRGFCDGSIIWSRTDKQLLWPQAKPPPPIKLDGTISQEEVQSIEMDEVSEKMEKVSLNAREKRVSASSTASAPPEPAPEPSIQDRHQAFYKELFDCLLRTEEEHFKVENLIAEINPLRMAYPDVTLEDLNGFLSQASFQLITTQSSAKGDQLFSRFKSVFERIRPLLIRYIKPESENAQLDCLVAIEEFAMSSPKFLDILQKIFFYLYDTDFLSEEAILQWFSDLEEDSDEVKTRIEKFVQWLEEAEEDESD